MDILSSVSNEKLLLGYSVALRISARLRDDYSGFEKFQAFISVCFFLSQNVWGGPNVNVEERIDITEEFFDPLLDVALMMEEINEDETRFYTFVAFFAVIFEHGFTISDIVDIVCSILVVTLYRF